MRYELDEHGARRRGEVFVRHDRRARRGRASTASRSTRPATSTSCGPGGVWILSPDGRAARAAAAARGPAQPRLGRRRRPHALHHRPDRASTASAWTSRACRSQGDLMSKNLEPGTDPPRLRAARRERRRCTACRSCRATTAWSCMLGRGEHCPRERLQQREMVEFHEWCPVAFTELVTVLPNDLHDTYKMRIADGRPLDLPGRRPSSRSRGA